MNILDTRQKNLFDWEKARELIAASGRKRGVIRAGLLEDWNNTANVIWKNGKFLTDSYCCVNSTWATPVLELNRVRVDCYKVADVAIED